MIMMMMMMCCYSNKGVQVELGIPYELWNRPSAEVSKMHRAVSGWMTFTVEKYLYNIY